MVKPTTHKPAADPEGLWKYICSMVDDDLARPTHPSFDHLLALPRIRDLNIIDKRLNPKHLIHSTLTVGLVIQVTGVERQTKQCTACRRGDGPFQECVSICPELANEVAQSNPPLATSPSNRWCCMNCVVNRQTSQCSLKASMLERSEDGSVKERIPHWMVDSEQRPPAGMAKKLKEASQDTVSVDDETNSSYRRSGRLRPQFETKPSSESPKRSFESMDMAFSQVAAAASQEEEASSSLRASKRVRGMQSPATVLTSSIQDSLMVEDWEMEAKVIPRGNGSSDSKYLQRPLPVNHFLLPIAPFLPSFPFFPRYLLIPYFPLHQQTSPYPPPTNKTPQPPPPPKSSPPLSHPSPCTSSESPREAPTALEAPLHQTSHSIRIVCAQSFPASYASKSKQWTTKQTMPSSISDYLACLSWWWGWKRRLRIGGILMLCCRLLVPTKGE